MQMNEMQINMASEWYVNLSEKDRAVVDYIQMFEHQIVNHGIDPLWFRIDNEKLICMGHDGQDATFKELVENMTVKIPAIFFEVDEFLPITLSIFRTQLQIDYRRVKEPEHRTVKFIHKER
tara:strand:- start:2705 stop:3067 length:363 start_codon:yes stop_codon:yes gene_type:complete